MKDNIRKFRPLRVVVPLLGAMADSVAVMAEIQRRRDAYPAGAATRAEAKRNLLQKGSP
jgi:hypothetical protein